MMRWEGHVACLREIINVYVLVRDLKGRLHVGDLDTDGKVILK